MAAPAAEGTMGVSVELAPAREKLGGVSETTEAERRFCVRLFAGLQPCFSPAPQEPLGQTLSVTLWWEGEGQRLAGLKSRMGVTQG